MDICRPDHGPRLRRTIARACRTQIQNNPKVIEAYLGKDAEAAVAADHRRGLKQGTVAFFLQSPRSALWEDGDCPLFHAAVMEP